MVEINSTHTRELASDDDRREGARIGLSDVKVFVAGILLDGDLDPSPIINLSAHHIFHLGVAALDSAACRPFCLRIFRWIFPSPLIVTR